MYQYFNPNPAGNMVRDCVVRAISKAEQQSWDATYWGICFAGYMTKDMPDANRTWGKYLENCGYKRGTLPNTCPDCYTVRQFAKDHPRGRYVVCTGNHAVAVIDGVYSEQMRGANGQYRSGDQYSGHSIEDRMIANLEEMAGRAGNNSYEKEKIQQGLDALRRIFN